MHGLGLEFDWDDANRNHLARHDVTPQEAEEVVLGDPLDIELQTAEGGGEERVLHVGRHAKDGSWSSCQRGVRRRFGSSPRGMRLGNPNWTIWPR